MKMIKIAVFFLIFLLPVHVTGASKSILLEQRETFIQAEKSLNKKNNSLFLKQVASIKNYPLYPYLQYQWLQKNLNRTHKIQDFLTVYGDTRYAELLNRKWLNHLVRAGDWTRFIKYYKPSKSTKLQCHYYWAKYQRGAKAEALQGAKKLWVVGKSQPNQCDAIFNKLKNSSLFTKDLLWQRFGAALLKKNVKLAKYVQRLMNKKDRKKANLWLKVHSNPSLVEKSSVVKQQNPQSGLIFAHGVRRLSRKNMDRALDIWDARKNSFTIDSATKQSLEQKLGMRLALNRDERAYGRLSQLTLPEEKAKEWRVRSALRLQNWSYVKESIAKLPKKLQEKDIWRYWLARALDKTGETVKAKQHFTRLSKDRSFYGYLSANRLNQSYSLADSPIQVTDQELAQFKQKTDFRVVAELLEVGKLREAKRQWWYSVRKLYKEDILTAAKYAQQMGWVKESIFTVAKAKYWDDVSLRFPRFFEKQVHDNAKIQKLNPAVIFGLIRQESVFDKNARSHVGARGLMQIMPKTGQYIARKLNKKWRGKNSLLNPNTNIRYGAYYYKHLLDQFDGHYALAAAAYNAGPHRVNRWLPKKGGLAADIWVETIPFKETRGYVAAVLTYSLIYQRQLKMDGLTMGDLMHEVFPG
jgi:soluble lytic murein transglycosylase